MQKRDVYTRRAGVLSVFALLWRRAFEQTEETSLAVFANEEQELVTAARAEADALVPPEYRGAWGMERKVTPRFAMACLIIPVFAAIAGGTLMATSGSSSEATCTFADGTTAVGRCMFFDTFTTLDSSVWLAEDNFPGPLLGDGVTVAAENRCFRHENAAASGGALLLTATSNARASCPQTWTTTSYYNTNYAACPTGGATTVDIAAITTKSFKFKYGHAQFQVKMPSSGGDISFWGTDCQQSQGVVGALSDLFTKGSGRTCNWPASGSHEMDVFQNSSAVMNCSHYVDNSVGSPRSITSFYGINYYGDLWASNTGAVSHSVAFIPGNTISDPTANFHIVDMDWRPGFWSVFIDGAAVALDTPSPSWVSTEYAFPMFWVIATSATTLTMTYFKIWCPTGVPCEWAGAGAL